MAVVERLTTQSDSPRPPDADLLFKEAKQRERRRRLLWLGAAVIVSACVAALIVGLTRGSVPSKHPSVRPARTHKLTPIGSTALPCSDSMLNASIPSVDVAGTVIAFYLTLSDPGRVACSLPQYPRRIALTGRANRVLPIDFSRGQSVAGQPLQNLAPKSQDTAYSIVSWTNWCGGPESVTGLRVWLRTGGASLMVHFQKPVLRQTPGCDSDNPSKWTIHDSGIMASNFVRFVSDG